MNRTGKTLGLLVVLLALAGGSGWFWWQRHAATDVAARYLTVVADRAAMQQTVSASGTLNPVNVVNVGTQISGVVKALHVDYNDHVEAGQVLAELDQSLLNAQLQQSQGTLASAQASLKLARANYARNKELYAKDYVPKADLDATRQALDSATAQVKSVQGQVARDQVNIGYSVIRSPVAGVVVSRDVDLGQTVAASFQTPELFKIAQDLKKMQIDTNLSEADVGAVKEGQEAHFTVDAFPRRSFVGVVRQIRLNPTTVQNVVTYDVVVDVNNDDLALLPGMTALVTIIEAQKPNVLRVPNAALSYRPADAKPTPHHAEKTETGDAAALSAKEPRRTIYVLKDATPQRVRIKTGLTDNKFTEVLEGEASEGGEAQPGATLQEGDAVITEETSGPNGATKASSRSGGMGPPRMF